LYFRPRNLVTTDQIIYFREITLEEVNGTIRPMHRPDDFFIDMSYYNIMAHANERPSIDNALDSGFRMFFLSRWEDKEVGNFYVMAVRERMNKQGESLEQ